MYHGTRASDDAGDLRYASRHLVISSLDALPAAGTETADGITVTGRTENDRKKSKRDIGGI